MQSTDGTAEIVRQYAGEASAQKNRKEEKQKQEQGQGQEYASRQENGKEGNKEEPAQNQSRNTQYPIPNTVSATASPSPSRRVDQWRTTSMGVFPLAPLRTVRKVLPYTALHSTFARPR
jgi:hypothetical protein